MDGRVRKKENRHTKGIKRNKGKIKNISRFFSEHSMTPRFRLGLPYPSKPPRTRIVPLQSKDFLAIGNSGKSVTPG